MPSVPSIHTDSLAAVDEGLMIPTARANDLAAELFRNVRRNNSDFLCSNPEELL